MFACSSVNYQSLLELIRGQQCTLNQVMDDEGFSTALRNDAPELIEFLLREEQLSIIITYALTKSNTNNLDPVFEKKMMRSSVNILISNSRTLQNSLMKNSTFVDSLRTFPSSHAIQYPDLCANFSNIIEHYLYSTQGHFIETEFPNLVPLLIDNIQILSFTFLVKTICCDYSSNFNTSYDLMKQLVQPPKQRPKIYALNKIVEDQPNLIVFLNTKEILEPLYELVLQTYGKDHMLCTLTCTLLSIINKTTEPNTLMNNFETEYGKKIDFSQPFNYSSASLLSVFPKFVSEFIDRFFEDDNHCNSQLSQSIYDALKVMNPNELYQIAIKHNIFSKIMQYYPTYLKRKTNGHYFQIVQLFTSKKFQCTSIHEPVHWKSFVETTFSERYKNIHIFYGEEPSNQSLSANARSEPILGIQALNQQEVPAYTDNKEDFYIIHSDPELNHLDNLYSYSSSNSNSSDISESNSDDGLPPRPLSSSAPRSRSLSSTNASRFIIKKIRKTDSSSDNDNKHSSSPIPKPTTKSHFKITRVPIPHPPAQVTSNDTLTNQSCPFINISATPQAQVPPSDPTTTTPTWHTSSSPFNIEVTAEIGRNCELDKKLMSRSLDQNAMKIVTSRFVINKQRIPIPQPPINNEAKETNDEDVTNEK